MIPSKPIGPWFRMRGYPHFDRPLAFLAAAQYVEDPASVARHAFYPFISFTIETPRYDKTQRKVIAKQRPIAYAAHLDAHIFAFYGFELSKKYERLIADLGLQTCVIGYRALGKSNIDHAADVFALIESYGDCVAIGLDIQSFF